MKQHEVVAIKYKSSWISHIDHYIQFINVTHLFLLSKMQETFEKIIQLEILQKVYYKGIGIFS